jgi:hypothetical protein
VHETTCVALDLFVSFTELNPVLPDYLALIHDHAQDLDLSSSYWCSSPALAASCVQSLQFFASTL